MRTTTDDIEEAGAPRHSFNYLKTVTYIGILVTVLSTAAEVASTALGAEDLKKEPEDDPFHVFNKLYFLVSTALAVNAIATLALYGPCVIEGLKNIYKYCASRGETLPEGWNPNTFNALSRQWKWSAGFIILTSAIFDLFAGIYYVSELPSPKYFNLSVNYTGWKFLTYLVSANTLISTIASEGPTLFENMLKLKPDEYFSNTSKCISQSFGYPLGVIGALMDMIAGYVSVVSFFTLQSRAAKWSTLAISLSNGAGDFCFSGKKGVEAIDAFVEVATALCRGTWKSSQKCRDTLFFIVSLATAVPLAAAQSALYTDFLADADAPLPFTPPQWLVMTFGLCTALQQGVVQTHALFKCLQRASNYFSNLQCFSLLRSQNLGINYNKMPDQVISSAPEHETNGSPRPQ